GGGSKSLVYGGMRWASANWRTHSIRNIKPPRYSKQRISTAPIINSAAILIKMRDMPVNATGPREMRPLQFCDLNSRTCYATCATLRRTSPTKYSRKSRNAFMNDTNASYGL